MDQLTTSRSSSRRSSILKPPKPHHPLQNLNLNNSSEENSLTTTTKLKRRVSFAEKKHVKEFCNSVEQGTVWDDTYEEHDLSNLKSDTSTEKIDGFSKPLCVTLETDDNSIVQGNSELRLNYSQAESEVDCDLDFISAIRTVQSTYEAAEKENVFPFDSELVEKRKSANRLHEIITVYEDSDDNLSPRIATLENRSMDFTEIVSNILYSNAENIKPFENNSVEFTEPVLASIKNQTIPNFCEAKTEQTATAQSVLNKFPMTAAKENTEDVFMEITEALPSVIGSTRNFNYTENKTRDFNNVSMEMTAALNTIGFYSQQEDYNRIGNCKSNVELSENEEGKTVFLDDSMDFTRPIKIGKVDNGNLRQNLDAGRKKIAEAWDKIDATCVEEKTMEITKAIVNSVNSMKKYQGSSRILGMMQELENDEAVCNKAMEITEALTMQESSAKNNNRTIHSDEAMEFTAVLPALQESPANFNKTVCNNRTMEITKAIINSMNLMEKDQGPRILEMMQELENNEAICNESVEFNEALMMQESSAKNNNRTIRSDEAMEFTAVLSASQEPPANFNETVCNNKTMEITKPIVNSVNLMEKDQGSSRILGMMQELENDEAVCDESVEVTEALTMQESSAKNNNRTIRSDEAMEFTAVLSALQEPPANFNKTVCINRTMEITKPIVSSVNLMEKDQGPPKILGMMQELENDEAIYDEAMEVTEALTMQELSVKNNNKKICSDEAMESTAVLPASQEPPANFNETVCNNKTMEITKPIVNSVNLMEKDQGSSRILGIMQELENDEAVCDESVEVTEAVTMQESSAKNNNRTIHSDEAMEFTAVLSALQEPPANFNKTVCINRTMEITKPIVSSVNLMEKDQGPPKILGMMQELENDEAIYDEAMEVTEALTMQELSVKNNNKKICSDEAMESTAVLPASQEPPANFNETVCNNKTMEITKPIVNSVNLMEKDQGSSRILGIMQELENDEAVCDESVEVTEAVTMQESSAKNNNRTIHSDEAMEFTAVLSALQEPPANFNKTVCINRTMEITKPIVSSVNLMEKDQGPPKILGMMQELENDEAIYDEAMEVTEALTMQELSVKNNNKKICSDEAMESTAVLPASQEPPANFNETVCNNKTMEITKPIVNSVNLMEKDQGSSRILGIMQELENDEAVCDESVEVTEAVTMQESSAKNNNRTIHSDEAMEFTAVLSALQEPPANFNKTVCINRTMEITKPIVNSVNLMEKDQGDSRILGMMQEFENDEVVCDEAMEVTEALTMQESSVKNNNKNICSDEVMESTAVLSALQEPPANFNKTVCINRTMEITKPIVNSVNLMEKDQGVARILGMMQEFENNEAVCDEAMEVTDALEMQESSAKNNNKKIRSDEVMKSTAVLPALQELPANFNKTVCNNRTMGMTKAIVNSMNLMEEDQGPRILGVMQELENDVAVCNEAVEFNEALTMQESSAKNNNKTIRRDEAMDSTAVLPTSQEPPENFNKTVCNNKAMVFTATLTNTSETHSSKSNYVKVTMSTIEQQNTENFNIENSYAEKSNMETKDRSMDCAALRHEEFQSRRDESNTEGGNLEPKESQVSISSTEIETTIELDPFSLLMKELKACASSDDIIWEVYHENMEKKLFVIGFISSSLLLVIYLKDEGNVQCIKDIKIFSRLADDAETLSKIVHNLVLSKFDPKQLMNQYRTSTEVFLILDHVTKEVKLAMDFMFDLEHLDDFNLMDINCESISFVSLTKKMDIILKVTVNVKPFHEIEPQDVSVKCLLGSVRENDVKKLIINVKKDHKFLRRFMSDVKDYIYLMEESNAN